MISLSLLGLELVHLGDGDGLVTGAVGSLPGSAGILPPDLHRALSQVELVLEAGAVHPAGVCLVTVPASVRPGHVATVVSAAAPAAPSSPAPGPLVPLTGSPAPVSSQSQPVPRAGARVPRPLAAAIELLLEHTDITAGLSSVQQTYRWIENFEVLNRVKLI